MNVVEVKERDLAVVDRPIIEIISESVQGPPGPLGPVGPVGPGIPLTRTVNGHPLSADVVVTKGDVGLGNVDDTADLAKPVSSPQQTALNLKANLISPALAGTPTTPTPAPGTNTTQIASTAFVAAAVALAVTGLLELQGNTDCSANPNYPAGLKGDLYYVSVAGKIGGASGKSVDIGDAYVCKADNAGGTEASVGTNWFVLEHNLAGALLGANNLSDLASASTARTNLGLGTAAVLNVGTSALNVVQIDASGKLPALDANSLSIKNSTVTTSGAPSQPSPYFYLSGRGWNDSGTPADQAVELRMRVVPVKKTGTFPYGVLTIDSFPNDTANAWGRVLTFGPTAADTLMTRLELRNSYETGWGGILDIYYEGTFIFKTTDGVTKSGISPAFLSWVGNNSYQAIAAAGYGTTFNTFFDEAFKFKCMYGGTGYAQFEMPVGIGTTTRPTAQLQVVNTSPTVPAIKATLAAGQSVDGIQLFAADGVTKLLAVSSAGIPIIPTKTPSSASDTGTAGMIAWDANYIYIATGTNAWKRAAIATW